MATRKPSSGCGEPELKRRRLLDAGGPIEDDETARRKMRDARVYSYEPEGDEIDGFEPGDVCQRRYHAGNKTSPMGYFAYKGDLPMMRWLYVNGADTRDEDVDFYFPVYGAALEGKLEACRWLYDHGAASDIKRRTRVDVSPLQATFDRWHRRDLSRCLILRGALCKDDGSGDLDLGLVGQDLDDGEECIEERRLLLEWANRQHQARKAFFVFLMGTLSTPEYSPLALRDLFLKRLQSEQATAQVLGLLPTDQHQQLWDNLIGKRHRSCPANRLVGASGVFEVIADYVGIVRGREARIIRQLTEILPILNVVLDQKYENVSSDEEYDINSGEEDE